MATHNASWKGKYEGKKWKDAVKLPPHWTHSQLTCPPDLARWYFSPFFPFYPISPALSLCLCVRGGFRYVYVRGRVRGSGRSCEITWNIEAPGISTGEPGDKSRVATCYSTLPAALTSPSPLTCLPDALSHPLYPWGWHMSTHNPRNGVKTIKYEMFTADGYSARRSPRFDHLRCSLCYSCILNTDMTSPPGTHTPFLPLDTWHEYPSPLEK